MTGVQTCALPISPSPRRNRGNYVNRMESQLTDSLRVLELEPGVTRRELNIWYRFLARQLHPDKHEPEVTGMTSEEAVELFKWMNNAQRRTQPSPTPRRNRGKYANNIESQLTDSLQVLELEPGVTRREVNVRYIFLA